MPRKALIGVTALFVYTSAVAAFGHDLTLAAAVKRQDRQTVRALLAKHADVNAPLADGSTALAWAVHWDDLQTADLLIRAGANVNAANENGVTPLLLASQTGNAAMVKKLLSARANPGIAFPTGATPLMMAARTHSLEAVRALLAAGADVNAREARSGQTALMWAISRRQSDVAKFLIQNGADVHARSASGFTALMFAARQADMESGRALLAAGADVNDALPDGMTALMVASASMVGTTTGEQVVVTPSDHERFALWLLDVKPNLAQADAAGRTALHYAVWASKLELVNALLARGADPNRQTLEIKRAGTPVNNFADTRDMMWESGETPFYVASKAADATLMRLLASAGADVRVPIKDGTTPLMAAAGVGRTDDRTRVTESMALEAVRTAVEFGLDVNAVNEEGMAAIHGATLNGLTSVIQLLADNGAKLDLKEKNGRTPLAIAQGGAGGVGNAPQKKAEELLSKLLGITRQNGPAQSR